MASGVPPSGGGLPIPSPATPALNVSMSQLVIQKQNQLAEWRTEFDEEFEIVMGDTGKGVVGCSAVLDAGMVAQGIKYFNFDRYYANCNLRRKAIEDNERQADANAAILERFKAKMAIEDVMEDLNEYLIDEDRTAAGVLAKKITKLIKSKSPSADLAPLLLAIQEGGLDLGLEHDTLKEKLRSWVIKFSKGYEKLERDLSTTMAENTELKTENIEFRQEIQRLKDLLRTVGGEKRDFEEALNSAGEDLEFIGKQNAKYRIQVAAHDTKTKELANKIHEQERIINEYKGKPVVPPETAHKLATALGELAQERTKKQTAEDKLQIAQADLATTQSKLATIGEAHKKECNTLIEKSGPLQEKISELRQELKEAKAGKSKMEQDCAAATAKQGAQAAELAKAAQTKLDLEDKYGEIQKSMERLEAQHKAAEKRMEDKITDQAKNIDTLNAKIRLQSEAIDTNATSLGEHQTTVNEQRRELIDLKEKLEQSAIAKQSAESQLQTLRGLDETNRNTSATEISAAKKAKEIAEAQTGELRVELEKWKSILQKSIAAGDSNTTTTLFSFADLDGAVAIAKGEKYMTRVTEIPRHAELWARQFDMEGPIVEHLDLRNLAMRIFANAKAGKCFTYAELRGLLRLLTPTTESWFAIALLEKSIVALSTTAIKTDKVFVILRALEYFHRITFFPGCDNTNRERFRRLFDDLEPFFKKSSLRLDIALFHWLKDHFQNGGESSLASRFAGGEQMGDARVVPHGAELIVVTEERLFIRAMSTLMVRTLNEDELSISVCDYPKNGEEMSATISADFVTRLGEEFPHLTMVHDEDEIEEDE